VKGVHWENLRTPDLSQQPVLGTKEIPRTGSCKPVEFHHCSWSLSTLFWPYNLHSTLKHCNKLFNLEWPFGYI